MSQKLPLLFIGHGSPMNAIEDNIYTKSWKSIAATLPLPRAILMLSAHWITEGKTYITADDNPVMIYDMYGFPEELYQLQYKAPGSQEISEEIAEHVRTSSIDHGNKEILPEVEKSHGFDHGVWSVLTHLFPGAQIPIIQISLDYTATPQDHYRLGTHLKGLREKGILIIGSGNIVHNLSRLDWSGKQVYPWALSFDKRIAKDIVECNHTDILDFQSWGEISRLAHPSYDHLLPLFPILGATSVDDTVEFFTSDIVMGSISMRSILWK